MEYCRVIIINFIENHFCTIIHFFRKHTALFNTHTRKTYGNTVFVMINI